MPDAEHFFASIRELVRDERWEQVKDAFARAHPADIAVVINHADPEFHDTLFGLVTGELKPEVLAELEAEAESTVLESLSNSEISDLMEEMAPDDAADVLAELTDERSEKVLDLMEDEESEDVRTLLAHAEDTAGGIMTTDVVAMSESQTVGEALEAIAYLDTDEQFMNAYVVDDTRRLVGYANLWELLRERNRSRPLGELAHRTFAAATVDTDQEEVAHLINKYDLNVLPVTDAEGRLVGRVTSDDIIDVIEEEASEDIFRLAGSDDAELESESVFRSCAIRLPWLLITLGGGFVTSLVLSRFHEHFSGMMVLAAFVPIVLAMGGNTGIQSSTLIVRSIALGDFNHRNILRMLLREIRTGALMGCICGTIIGLWASVMAPRGAAATTVLPIEMALIVGMALFSAMMFAALFGAAVPILLNRTRVDPAVAAGPFVTITNDISALLIYFGVATLLAHLFA